MNLPEGFGVLERRDYVPSESGKVINIPPGAILEQGYDPCTGKVQIVKRDGIVIGLRDRYLKDYQMIKFVESELYPTSKI